MVPDSAFIHVLAPVDVRNFTGLYNKAAYLLNIQFRHFKASKPYKNAQWYDPLVYKMEGVTLIPTYTNGSEVHCGISIAHQIKELYQTFTTVFESLPKQSDLQRKTNNNLLPRQKRAIGYIIGLVIALIVGAVIGTYLGPYTQQQINALPLVKDVDLLLHIDDQHHELVDNLEKRVNLAFKLLAERETEYKNLDSHVDIWNAVIRQLEHRTNQFVDFVSHLQHHRLSMTWFSTEQLRKIHNSVLQQAAQNNLTPLTTHLSDYFQLDVSYVVSDHYITAIIHVPATASPYNFKVYRYVPFPIPIANDSFLTITAREDIIAVGHNNEHRVLTQTQLNHCIQRYQKFICESPLITNTNFSTTCVGSLMDHNSFGIQAHCSLTTSPAQERVFQIANNQFAIYSPVTFTGRGLCLNGSHISALISRITKVTVPSGCNLSLRNHVLTVPVNVISASEPWVQSTKWDTLEVPRQLFANEVKRTNAIHQLFQDDEAIRTKVESQLDASLKTLNDAHDTIAQNAKNIITSVTNHHYLFIALSAAAALIASALCVCLCCRYCSAQPQYVPAPQQMTQLQQYQ